MIGELPKRITINGKEYAIRTNYKDILKILEAFNDVELKENEKVYICLTIIYKAFESMPKTDYEEAFKKAVAFIDAGIEPQKKKTIQTVDWQQDEVLIFSALTKSAGFDVRTRSYIHWWTFLGYYLEMPDCVYATVLRLRTKKANREKLEKWEQKFWNDNKDICVIKPKYSAEEQAQIDRLNKMLG